MQESMSSIMLVKNKYTIFANGYVYHNGNMVEGENLISSGVSYNNISK